MTNNYFKAIRVNVIETDAHGRTATYKIAHKIETFDDRDRDDIVRAWDLIRTYENVGYSLSVMRKTRDSGRWDSVPAIGEPVRAAVLP